MKRSRSRLQSTLQSEELNPSESGGAARVRAFDPLSKTRSSIDIMDVPGSQQSVSSDAMPTTAEARQDESSSQQLDTWRAIFTSMDDVLVTEATKLVGGSVFNNPSLIALFLSALQFLKFAQNSTFRNSIPPDSRS